jgi:hypothetical protein
LYILSSHLNIESPPECFWRKLRIAKRLKNDFSGKVRIDRHEDVADLDRTLQVVERVAEKTRQRKLSRGFNTDAPLLEFFKTQAEMAGFVFTLSILERNLAPFGLDLSIRTHSSAIFWDTTPTTPGIHQECICCIRSYCGFVG